MRLRTKLLCFSFFFCGFAAGWLACGASHAQQNSLHTEIDKIGRFLEKATHEFGLEVTIDVILDRNGVDRPLLYPFMLQHLPPATPGGSMAAPHFVINVARTFIARGPSPALMEFVAVREVCRIALGHPIGLRAPHSDEEVEAGVCACEYVGDMCPSAVADFLAYQGKKDREEVRKYLTILRKGRSY